MKRKILAGAVVAVVAGGLGIAGITTAFAASTGTVVSAANGKCLDVTGGSTANGNQPQMWACSTGPNQSWTFADDGSVRGLGKCLDVANGATTDGAAVHLWDCYAGLTSQQWTLNASRDLVNVKAGKCLDIKDNNLADGAKLQIWSCGGGANQKWTHNGGPVTPPTTVPPNPNNPDLGPNVTIFDPSMSASTIQSRLNQVFNSQVTNQFGTARYALLFKPGAYNVDANVGFFTQVAGLG
ncbi:MAG: RICIN domain-containing protein, partial [Actinoplanes sp.]